MSSCSQFLKIVQTNHVSLHSIKQSTKLPRRGNQSYPKLTKIKKNISITMEKEAFSPNPETPDIEAGEKSTKKSMCHCMNFSGSVDAKAYSLIGIARGTIVMSNIFYSTALLTLANKDACPNNPSDCNEKVYGFKPSSLITNVAIISGVLSAFLMPIIGALIDFTPHRKNIGIITALLMTAIQAVQIYLVPATWFVMAIFQGVAGFIYMVNVLAVYAYLPDLSRNVGETKMNAYTSKFVMMQFGAQAAYLVFIAVISVVFDTNNVVTARISQAVDSVLLIPLLGYSWWIIQSVSALHEIPKESSLLSVGFKQIIKTAKGINANYRSLKWFFIAVSFAASGANAFTTVSVTYMVEVMKMDSLGITLIFIEVLLMTIPGSYLTKYISNKLNPVTAFKLCLILFSVFTIAGGFVLDRPERKSLMYVWGVLWGITLGMFYPTQDLIFSMSVPKGQESELTGFLTYCTQIIVWLPPLIFTAMNETGISMTYGLMSLVIFFLIAIGFLQLLEPWDDIVRHAKEENKILNQVTTIEKN